MNLHFDPAVKLEMAEAAAWYEDQQSGLGHRLLKLFDDAVARIVESPDSLPLLETWSETNTVRRLKLPKFPYIVVFEVEEDTICVLALAHTSRQSDYWTSRRTSSS